MALNLRNIKLTPPVFLAPMAGVTDVPSRAIAKLFSPGLVVSEMIASSEKNKEYFEKTVKDNLYSGNKSSRGCPTAIQIAGHEIEWMTYAAKVIEFEGGDVIDINMGCPAKKIVGRLAGSALMKEPKHALKMLEAIVNSTTLPVTLKMRLGWDLDNINAPYIAKSAEDIGIQMITIHARTRNQFFNGKAYWSLVKAVKNLVSVPVIVNGDIVDKTSAADAIQNSFADGIMIGRGAIGNPWLISELANFLYSSSQEATPAKKLSPYELINLHLQKTLNFYGRDIGLKKFRRHLCNYLKPIALESSYRKSIMTENSINLLEGKLKAIFFEKSQCFDD